MKKNKLSESAVKKAKPTAKQFKLSDGGGLYLLVHSNGSKYWRFDFRFDGKQKSSSLGVWPEVSLETARRKRDHAKNKIKEGKNPIQEKKKKNFLHIEQVQETVEKLEVPTPQQISQQGEIQQASQSPGKNTKLNINLLKAHIFTEFGEKHVSELSKEDMTENMKKLYCSRREVFQLIWDIYPCYPLVQLSVMFILLLAVMDLFSALLTTSLYIGFTVCITIGINVWHEKNIDSS